MTGRPGEDELIARYFAPMADPGGLALKDDAALLAPTAGHELVVTTDTVVHGVHYLPDDPAASIARKALGVNVSDLVAKGARPRGFVLSLGLPEDWTEEWLAAFAAGLGEAAADLGCPLLGGDTVRVPGGAVIGVTALGEVPAGRMLRRTTARPGDRLCVTGTIGDAALGLVLRRERDGRWARGVALPHRAFLADRYLHPKPRLEIVPALLAHARAAMDVSDGLAGDLAKMMRAGGTTAVVDVPAVPLSPAAGAVIAASPPLLDRALTGGDDYEVLFAVPEASLGALLAEADGCGVPVAVIGTVAAGDGPPLFRNADGSERRFAQASYSHF
jgi:thiamine-monophosphate kinase